MNHRHLVSIVCATLSGSFGCASVGHGPAGPMYAPAASANEVSTSAPASAPMSQPQAQGYGRVASNEATGSVVSQPVYSSTPSPSVPSAGSSSSGPASRVSVTGHMDVTTESAGDGAPRTPSYEPPATMRQGLATEWGETRQSTVGYTSFTRASAQPFDQAAIYYNDASGVSAQASFRATQPVTFAGAYHDGVRVSLRDETGAALSGYFVNGRLYVLGAGGQRYTIMIENNTSARFEAVVSVDGLDVINGRPASTGFRGYIIPAYGHIAIDGVRQDQGHVAAFRFGAVGDSYAAQTGSARNVGVIGVALYSEYGVAMPSWEQQEVQLRETANPFPGQYAAPPPRRNYQ